MANREWEVGNAISPIEGKTVQDFLYFEGMYNPTLRFSFTNVLEEDFVSYWNSQRYIVKAHQSVKLPHHLAQKFTKEIVDKMMMADNKGVSMAVPASRKPYEDKVVSLLPAEESSEMEIIRNEFIEKVNKDASRQVGEPDEPIEPPKLDFEDLSRQDFGKGKKK